MEIVIVGCPPIITQRPRPQSFKGIPNPNLPNNLFKKTETTFPKRDKNLDILV